MQRYCLRVPRGLRPTGVPAAAPAARPTARPSRRARVAAAAAAARTPEEQPPRGEAGRRALLGAAAAALVLGAPALGSPAGAAPFLASTGGKGILAQEEAQLYQFRVEKEGEARREIEKERELLESEARSSQIGKLCATPFGIDIVGITEFVALVGALVGGITARQRKAELERLNEQLRKINQGLRQQARAGTVYAPGLTYAPPTAGSSNGNGNGAAPAAAAAAPLGTTATATAPRPAAVVVAAPRPSPAPDKTLFSMDEDEMTTDQIQCRDALRVGKRFLKEGNGAAAMVRFEKALMLSKALDNKVQERRATRGLAAAARLQGSYRAAIGHLERVLDISKGMGEYTGDADALGVIADCFTDLGDFEKAAAYYDRYIDAMTRDGPV